MLQNRVPRRKVPDTGEQEEAKELHEERKADQKAVDGKIKGLDADMSLYLKSKFSLTKSRYPHR